MPGKRAMPSFAKASPELVDRFNGILASVSQTSVRKTRDTPDGMNGSAQV